MKRYIVQHESCGDYAVVDVRCSPPIVKASGLDQDEAEETAAAWNKKDAAEREEYANAATPAKFGG